MSQIEKTVALSEDIVGKVQIIRGIKVMLDSDLAELYGVDTKRLNEAAKRNVERFPKGFMFQLVEQEYKSLRSQNETLKRGQHKKYLPYVFTEQGVAMLSSVLKSKRAIEMNIAIIRAFVQMRQLIDSNRELADRIDKLETEVGLKHIEYNEQLFEIMQAIRRMVIEDKVPERKIGFKLN